MNCKPEYDGQFETLFLFNKTIGLYDYLYEIYLMFLAIPEYI